MGWLPQFRSPERYDPTWVQKLVEGMRTAVNFILAKEVTQDTNNRFVTDTDKTNWNGKVNKAGDTLTGALALASNFSNAIQLNSNGNPDDSLYFTTTHAGGGNCYTYYRVASPNYVIQIGDYLEYDIQSDISNVSGICDGGCEFDFSDLTNGRNFFIPDQNNISLLQGDHSAYSKGRWYHRKHDLTPVVGKTISSFDLVEENDIAGKYVYYYRKIIITNGSVIKAVIWHGGRPSASTIAYWSLASSASTGGSYFAGLHVVGIPIYATNAAAITGGLTAGAFYRTGADPDPVCVVH